MKHQNKIHTELINIAKKATNEFAGGNVIGGLGITGILLLVSGIAVFYIDISTMDQVNEAPLYLGTLLGGVGSLFILISGLLYIQKVKMRHESLTLLVKGYFDITTVLVSKINQGTVASKEVIELAEKYFNSAVFKLMGDSGVDKQEEDILKSGAAKGSN